MVIRDQGAGGRKLDGLDLPLVNLTGRNEVCRNYPESTAGDAKEGAIICRAMRRICCRCRRAELVADFQLRYDRSRGHARLSRMGDPDEWEGYQLLRYVNPDT